MQRALRDRGGDEGVVIRGHLNAGAQAASDRPCRQGTVAMASLAQPMHTCAQCMRARSAPSAVHAPSRPPRRWQWRERAAAAHPAPTLILP